MENSVLNEFDKELKKSEETVDKAEAGTSQETKENEKEVSGNEMKDKTNKKDAEEAGDNAPVNKSEDVLSADDVKEIVKSVLTETFANQNEELAKNVKGLATSEQLDKTIGVFAKAYSAVKELNENIEKNVNKSLEDNVNKSIKDSLDDISEKLEKSAEDATLIDSEDKVAKSTDVSDDDKTVDYVAKSASETPNDDVETHKDTPEDKEEVEKSTVNRLDLLERYNSRMKNDISKGVYAASPDKMQVIKSIGSSLAFNRLGSEDELEFAKNYADGGNVTLE
ncbi:hypothetical protein [Levilactobacillus phage ENFP1]|nr:hypothetical protein [Levilactobacillus phage ENFP1]